MQSCKKIDISFLDDVKHKEVILTIRNSNNYEIYCYVNDVMLMENEIMLEVQLRNGFIKFLSYEEIAVIELLDESEQLGKFLYLKNHIEQ